MDYKFLPIQTDTVSIKKITKLLNITFPKVNKYTEEFISWQYIDNPTGAMIGCNAYLGEELAAHYALMPIKAKVFGREEKGLLSLNTATHPNHRGKRLFPTLAAESYAAAVDQGFSFVIGVANAQSTPGFLRKLDFQLIGMLEAKLGIGKIYREEGKAEIQYQRSWNKESIQWRLTNPALTYIIRQKRVLAPTDYFGIQAVLRDFENTEELPVLKNTKSWGILKLWLGIDHGINWNRSFYFDIPKRLRPSPLNLIFKDLTGQNRTFKFSEVNFSALDFDAY